MAPRREALRAQVGLAVELRDALGDLIGVALLCLLIRRVPWTGFLAWTVVFVVAGALVYGPLLDAVVGTSSGGVTYSP